MAHVLLVESWVGAMSRLLPGAILEAGHGFSFLTRDLHHYLRDAPAGGGHPLLAARNLFTAETNDVPALLAHVERLHEAVPFDGVLTSCDYYLETVALLAARLGLPGPDPGATRTAYRKDLSRTALDRAGVPQPEFALAEGWTEVLRAAERIGFPVVLKPVDLCAGLYVRQVADRAELLAAFDAVAGFPVNARRQPRVPTLLIEELMTGPEVSVETVTVDGTTHVIGVTDKSLGGTTGFVETGHMFPAALDAADAEKTAVAALEAVGLDRGVAHTELRLTAAGPKVVEVNPRPAGNQITELVRRVTGIDLPMVYAQLAIGETPDLTRTDTGVGSAAIAFVLPPRAGTVDAITPWPDDGRIVDSTLRGPGHRAGDASSNNDYLGYVMTVDERPGAARATADALAARAEVSYA